MKFFALFALLPLLASAAPLNLGPIQVLPGTQNPKVPTVPVLPAVPDVKLPSQVGTTIGSVLALGSDGHGILGAGIGGVKPDSNSALVTVGNLTANITATANATLTNGVKGVVDDKAGLTLGKTGSALVNGTVGAGVAQLSTETPSLILSRLSSYIAGLKAPSLTAAIAQLTFTRENLDLAIKNEVQSIKDNVEISNIISYTVQLIKNLNAYLIALDKQVKADSTLLRLAAEVDTLLAAYIKGLQIIGIATDSFLDAAYKLGLTGSGGLSPLLVKTAAIFPPSPAGPKITAGL